MTDLLRLAVLDNAAWCRLVSSDLNGVGVVDTCVGVLFPGRVPEFYPNFVSVDADVSRRDARLMVAALREADLPAGFGIKDSFANLDLGRDGFDCAIEGQWLGFDGAIDDSPPVQRDLSISWPRDVTGIDRWLEVAGMTCIDPVKLCRQPLASKRVSFLEVRRNDEIVAGAVLTSFGPAQRPVLGVSNVFAREDDLPVWTLIMTAARRRWRGCVLVGWEADASIESAQAAGFRTLHPMRVWIDEGRAS